MSVKCPRLQASFEATLPGYGESTLFALYAAMCALSIGFVARCVPETKGKSLEEIEAMLVSRH